MSSSTWKKKAIWLSYDFPDQVLFQGGRLFLKSIDLVIDPAKFEFILDGFDYIKQLHEFGKFKFTIEGEYVVASNGVISSEIHTAEELFILREIWLGKDYSFMNTSDVIIIDVGMNVGHASLYFASRDDVKHVYGYEPFVPTYNQCKKNLERNSSLAQKITTYNYGLSNEEKVLEVDYDYANKGQVGIHGTALIRSVIKSESTERIELLPACQAIRKIIDRHPGFEFFCKIDCEGGEYDIFQDFFENGIPESIKGFMIEWHDRGPNELLSILKSYKYKGVSTNTYSQKVGMLYAFRD